MPRREKDNCLNEGVWWQIAYSGGKGISRTAFPSRKQPPLTWNPQAHGVTDIRLEFICVEPGLWEAATEAGVQGFTQKWWQPLGGKQSSGNILDISTPRKEPLTSERSCDKIVDLIPCCLSGYKQSNFSLQCPKARWTPSPIWGALLKHHAMLGHQPLLQLLSTAKPRRPDPIFF